MKIFEAKRHVFDLDEISRIERNYSKKGMFDVFLKNNEVITITTFEKNRLVKEMKAYSLEAK